mmetsp:Transcript_29668/g.36108  ORF Transcript_29668/g.36108 Transcript_29668/m.36108 type:complete len:476 (+) Transcript_29668:104-1531(+)|eukprot:CAMPEP_0172510238 /NCGR_PEP_ID=MMETSP1066-20121228/227204_1 /TAXON_ID=671091 /ORGANISM="Coscinodiscus wailesii, Strain CCMP2513" /LENGTH=475 /DNA_ID=CAMNT_0013289109 /DNA_START=103 /DNA_END=1530 /DNA_ORIENTATION=-
MSTLRRRNVPHDNNGMLSSSTSGGGDSSSYENKRRVSAAVRKLDMFPKVERDLTVSTDHGGLMTLIGYGVILFLIFCELLGWIGQNRERVEHLVVDTSLGKKMRVNLNMTFPALHCDDLHLDVMDVAGDSQLNIEDTLVKRRMNLEGSFLPEAEIRDRVNKATEAANERERLVKASLVEGYCGPCYGAGEEGDCCQTCEDVKKKYQDKRWGTEQLMYIAEQCIREGVKFGPKKVKAREEGCNLSGYMELNRVNGNFHVAMGDGVERDGHHIHLFLPEDRPNFNVSHIIHELSFGPKYTILEQGAMDGMHKIATVENGGPGLFQYFIKVVPTIYKDTINESTGEATDTNRFFFTERFRPLLESHELSEYHFEMGKDVHAPNDENENRERAGAKLGGGHGAHQKHHHTNMNGILPGVFFVYEIYPFAVEVSTKSVTLTHLIIRIMALFGGVLTITGWIDGYLTAKSKNKGKGVTNGY